MNKNKPCIWSVVLGYSPMWFLAKTWTCFFFFFDDSDYFIVYITVVFAEPMPSYAHGERKEPVPWVQMEKSSDVLPSLLQKWLILLVLVIHSMEQSYIHWIRGTAYEKPSPLVVKLRERSVVNMGFIYRWSNSKPLSRLSFNLYKVFSFITFSYLTI